jgi:hypothetical protein
MWILDLELLDGNNQPFTGSLISLSDYDSNKNQGYWSFSEGFAGFTLFARTMEGYFETYMGSSPPNMLRFYDMSGTLAFVLYNAPYSRYSHYSQAPHGSGGDSGGGQIRSPGNPIGTQYKLRWDCMGSP